MMVKTIRTFNILYPAYNLSPLIFGFICFMESVPGHYLITHVLALGPFYFVEKILFLYILNPLMRFHLRRHMYVCGGLFKIS